MSLGKVLTIIILVIVILLLLGACKGFPWERAIVKENAKKYVLEEYGLTLTKSRVTFLFNDWVGVTVATQEYDFSITLHTRNRKDLGGFTDNYLKMLAQHKLKQSVNDEIEKLIGKNNSFGVNLAIRIPSGAPEPPILTLDEINSDMLFEKLSNQYSCFIMFNDMPKNNLNVDYELNYRVFKLIISQLQPNQITFYYQHKDKYIAQIVIENSEYEKINLPDDIKDYFRNVDW